MKSQLVWKDPDAGKDWGQEEKGVVEDEIVGYWHDGKEFEQTLGDSEDLFAQHSTVHGVKRVRHDLVTE